MKKFKRIMAVLMAAFSLSLLIPTIAPVQAASSTVYYNYGTVLNKDGTTKYDKNGNPVRKSCSKMQIGLFSESSFSITEKGTGATISGLKVSGSGLKAAFTYNYFYKPGKYDTGIGQSQARVGLYATKPGTYKVSFKVGKKKYSVTVKAVENSSIFKSASFAGQTISSHDITYSDDGYTSTGFNRSKVSKSSGKFFVSANSGYKITGIVVGTVDKKGKISYKKIKNGGKVSLSKGKLKTVSNYSEFYSDKAYTYVWVSYKNTYTGVSDTFSVGKDPVTKQKAVKCVHVDKIGQKTTSYHTGSNYIDYAIWK